MVTLAFTVCGSPASQGSKRHVGRGIMVESSKKLAPWRQDVVAAALNACEGGEGMFTGPVRVELTFLLPRPKAHYRTGANAHLLRDTAPAWPIARTLDVDKAVRATLDPLVTAGVLADDALVVELRAFKVYTVPGELPGARIAITDLTAGDHTVTHWRRSPHVESDPTAHRPLDRIALPPAWTADALCTDVAPELFFPGPGRSAQPARAVCAACPVAASCLDYALEHGEQFGVWGGTTYRQRMRLPGRRESA